MRKMSQRSSYLIIWLFAAATLVIGGLAVVHGQFIHNLASIYTVHTLASRSANETEARLAVETYARRMCQRHWLLGSLALRYDDQAKMIEEWENALRCDSSYMTAMRMEQPENQALAVLATTAYPDLAESWFWLAQLQEHYAPEEAISSMIRGLELRPEFGIGWYHLGELFESAGKLDRAIDAFIESGKFLNKGSDHFFKVGSIYERLGNPRRAIYFYRRSLFEGAFQRAAYLESKLSQ